jgi:hypothetical protein
MRMSARCFNTSWIRVFSLLVPVGPPLGLDARDEHAWEELVDCLG